MDIRKTKPSTRISSFIKTFSASYITPSYVTSGLILYLDCSESQSYPGSGSTWYDLSGNSNHFTINGLLTFSSSNGFNGFSSTNRIYRNSFPSNLKTSQGGSGYTTIAIARTTDASRWQKLMGNGDEMNYIDLYAVDGTGLYYQEDGSSLFYNNGISVQNNSFDMGDNILRMYGSTNLNGGSTSNPTDAFGIASEGDGIYPYGWNGNFFAAMIYNKVLSPSEITQTYQYFQSKFPI